MQAKHGPYGGETAAILWSSFSPYAGVVGLVALGLLAGVTRLFIGGVAERLLPALLFATCALLVVRVALQSAFGRYDAGLFRNDGSTWGEAFFVLGRVMALNFVWLLPVTVLLSHPNSLLLLMRLNTVPGPGIALALIALAVAPPLMVVACLTATRFPDILSPAHWRATFAGRAQDTFALLAGGLGGVLIGIWMVQVGAAGLAHGHGRVTSAVMVLVGSYSLGMALLLMGRLMGGFVRTGALALDLPEESHEPALEQPPPPAEAEALAPARAPMAGVTGAVDGALREKLFAAPAEDTKVAADEPPAMPPGMTAAGATGAVRPLAATAEHALPSKGQLANASLLELLRANERTAKTDPQKAIAEVSELVAGRGRHPQLLARLAVLEAQLHRPQAVHTAKDAAQLACSMGNHGAVAELLEPFRGQLDELALSADDWVKVANAQKALKRMDQAVSLYQRVLSAAPRNLAAIKGLVQIADEHLKQDAADLALAIYDYLDGQCQEHPFREFTDRGREQAERKLLSTR